MCEGACNIPDDELAIWVEKQLLPFDLGERRCFYDTVAGSVHIRFEAYYGKDRGDMIVVSLWFGDGLEGFYCKPDDCTEEKLRDTLTQKLKATEADIEPVVAVWKKEIIPLLEDVKKPWGE